MLLYLTYRNRLQSTSGTNSNKLVSTDMNDDKILQNGANDLVCSYIWYVIVVIYVNITMDYETVGIPQIKSW
jgi:hypothetical protein